MKKIITVLVLALAFTNVSAKKIKFAVDMGTGTISPLGVHLMGNFQAYLGLPLGDWQPNTLSLTQEGTSSIYSVILNLPAFIEYEYKFVNGDQSYEAEFVPNVARVEPFAFNDNRWIYLDSLQNDTTFVGAIPFSGTAPAGKTLIRFVVDMSNAGTISPNGVHVAGTFQSATWSPVNTIMYSFGLGLYEVIAYATNGNYEFKYYNGKTLGNTEVVPSPCATSGNRSHNLAKDTILETVCFSACVNCALAGIHENENNISGIKVYPNPLINSSSIEFTSKDLDYNVSISDMAGRVLKTYFSTNGNTITIEKEQLRSGLYFVNVVDSKNARSSSKLIIE